MLHWRSSLTATIFGPRIWMFWSESRMFWSGKYICYQVWQVKWYPSSINYLFSILIKWNVTSRFYSQILNTDHHGIFHLKLNLGLLSLGPLGITMITTVCGQHQQTGQLCCSRSKKKLELSACTVYIHGVRWSTGDTGIMVNHAGTL